MVSPAQTVHKSHRQNSDVWCLLDGHRMVAQEAEAEAEGIVQKRPAEISQTPSSGQGGGG